MTTHRAHDDDLRFPFASLADSTASLVTDVLGHVERLVTGVVADAEEVARDARNLWDFTREQATVFGHTVRSLPRFTRVAGELLRVAADYRWHFALAEARGGRREAETQEALRAVHGRNARRLYALCVELRGAVLKLGQFASSRIDLLPDAYVRELSLLQDRVPPVPFEAIAERIELELAEGARSFAAFDAEPLAAASFAQVHAARLGDGRRVAVKVQVPEIEDDVEADLAALRLLAPALGDLLPSVDLDTIVNELTTAVRGELDYGAEAANAMALADCLRADPDVVVPGVHEDLSTRRVLTLEHVAGERIVDYLDACERRGAEGARDRDRLFAVLVRTFCAQVLEHGVLHADPHPGNFLVQAAENGPRLVLLDFGCVQRYSPARRRAYAQLGFAVLAGDRERLAELFAEMGFASRDGGTSSLGAFADLMLEAFRSDSAAPLEGVDPAAAMERVLRLTRDNPIVAIPGDFVLLGRVFASLGGLLMRYRPHVNLFQILMPYLARAGA
jgi:predicted unusual protein kinase regulating ubiquinone biosynthesis (AarF/ABC1/UbiB family)